MDYYSQYSIGQPWLFSFLLGKSADQAITNYVIFAILTTWLFFAQLLYLLHWLYKSWMTASIITFLFLLILFHGDRHFFDPSSSILRYPLLGVCAWIFARWIERPTKIRQITLAGILALSIFFNTETGIISIIAVSFASFIQNKRITSIVYSLLTLGVITLFLLITLIISIFGFRTLQIEFLTNMLTPLVYFGKYGFGGWPIAWNLDDLNWFYNLAVPGIALGTLALIIRSKNTEPDQPRLAILAFFAITGLLMMAKFINMSIIGLWQMNSLGFFILLGWWGNVWVLKNHPLKQYLIWSIMACGAYYLLNYANDSRNPATLGLQSWVSYPSLARSILYREKGCENFECVENQAGIKDIELIQERTSPDEQVAIIDLYDWTYLIGAHRPPLMFFLPSSVIFTKRQLTESLQRLKTTRYLFLPKGKDKIFNFGHEDLKNGIAPTFTKDYVYDGEGERLIAWKRKNIAGPSS
jgi:hypothetical protein